MHLELSPISTKVPLLIAQKCKEFVDNAMVGKEVLLPNPCYFMLEINSTSERE